MRFVVQIWLVDGELSRETLSVDLIQREVLAIKSLLASGVVEQAWKRSDKIGLVLVLQAADESECLAVLQDLPFARANILGIEKPAPVEPYLDVF